MADRRYIQESFQHDEVFRYVDDLHLRAKMLDASFNYPMMILSLKAFLENTKYMKAMTAVIKRAPYLQMPKGTIRQTTFRYYMSSESRTFSIQCSKYSYIERQAPNRYDFGSAYRQVYVFAMRNFCGLTDCYPLGRFQSKVPRQLWSVGALSKSDQPSGICLPRQIPKAFSAIRNI